VSWLAGRAAVAGYCDIVMVGFFFVGISGGSLRLKFGILTSRISVLILQDAVFCRFGVVVFFGFFFGIGVSCFFLEFGFGGFFW